MKYGARMSLQRSLGLPSLLFYGVGTIVGAGIYSVIGAAGGIAGYGTWIGFGLASVVALLTALSYAELVSMRPKAGAEYQFLRLGFPSLRVLAPVAGMLVALNAAATAATVALAFGGYLQVFIDLPVWAAALALLSACTLLNVAGIRHSTAFGITLVCIEVGGLLLLIGAGATGGQLAEGVRLTEQPGIGAILAATALLFFVFIGFEDIANLAEESNEPQRDIPRALLVSVVVTSTIYLLVAFTVFGTADPQELSKSSSPLTLAGNRIAPWLGTTLAVTALFATASTALISLVAISRLLFAMGREGDMPEVLARTSRRHVPWVAALVLFAAACALLPLGKVETVASLSAFGLLIVFIGVQSSMIALRLREPAVERPFRVPVAIGRWPMAPIVGIAACAALLTQFERIVYVIGVSVIAMGVLLFAVQRRRAVAADAAGNRAARAEPKDNTRRAP
jgi:APA family basic amino acid/polyamine antiporter